LVFGQSVEFKSYSSEFIDFKNYKLDSRYAPSSKKQKPEYYATGESIGEWNNRVGYVEKKVVASNTAKKPTPPKPPTPKVADTKPQLPCNPAILQTKKEEK